MRLVQQHLCEVRVDLRAGVVTSRTWGIGRTESLLPKMSGRPGCEHTANSALYARQAFNDPFHGGGGVGS